MKFLGVQNEKARRFELTIKMGDLRAQFKEIEQELFQALNSIFETSNYVMGPQVAAFEAEFAQFTGADNVIGVANGTDALELIILALQLPKGSTILVPANSFVASAEAVINTGHKLRLVDVQEDFQIDLDSLASCLSPDVSAIVLVHLYGYPNSVERIRAVPGLEDIAIIEDCAQAQGAIDNGMHVGIRGTAGAFSFYPGKNLGALGDAGAVITQDAALAERIRRISNHGRLGKFDHETVGRNSRLDVIQAAVLSLKLKNLDKWNDQRRRNALRYHVGLEDLLGLIRPPAPSAGAVFHHYVIQVENRDKLRVHLSNCGIETGIHYPQAIGQYSIYEAFVGKGNPRSEELSSRILSLPVAEHLGDKEINSVVNEIRKFVRLTPS
jgi:dTDP-4-amino-4,6-dideoxygalactose transaminase